MKLYLDRLIDLLKRNNYKIKKLYCLRKECKYVSVCASSEADSLCESFQDVFFIRIPDQYVMLCGKSSKRIPIRTRRISTTHRKQWSKLSSDVTKDDIAYLSSKTLTVFCSKGSMMSYTVGEEDTEKPSKKPDDENEKKDILVEAKELEMKVERKSRVKNGKIAIIEFQEEDGTPVDVDEEVVKELSNKNPKTKDDDTASRKESDKEIEKSEEEDDTTPIEDVASRREDEDDDEEEEETEPIEEAEIRLGKPYIVFHLSDAFKKIDRLGDKTERFVKKLKKIDKQVRKDKIKEIKEGLDGIKTLIDNRYKSTIEKIKRTNERRDHLLQMLEKMNSLEEKVEEEELTEKYLRKIERLRDNATKKLHDYSVRLLTLEENLDTMLNDLLDTVNTTVEELTIE